MSQILWNFLDGRGSAGNWRWTAVQKIRITRFTIRSKSYDNPNSGRIYRTPSSHTEPRLSERDCERSRGSSRHGHMWRTLNNMHMEALACGSARSHGWHRPFSVCTVTALLAEGTYTAGSR
jgi:hypothetical protein